MFSMTGTVSLFVINLLLLLFFHQGFTGVDKDLTWCLGTGPEGDWPQFFHGLPGFSCDLFLQKSVVYLRVKSWSQYKTSLPSFYLPDLRSSIHLQSLVRKLLVKLMEGLTHPRRSYPKLCKLYKKLYRELWAVVWMWSPALTGEGLLEANSCIHLGFITWEEENPCKLVLVF